MKISKILIFVFIVLSCAAFLGCATTDGFRELDEDEMDLNPVCEIRLKRFTPTAEPAALEYKGNSVFYCCADCVEKFKKYFKQA